MCTNPIDCSSCTFLRICSRLGFESSLSLHIIRLQRRKSARPRLRIASRSSWSDPRSLIGAMKPNGRAVATVLEFIEDEVEQGPREPICPGRLVDRSGRAARSVSRPRRDVALAPFHMAGPRPRSQMTAPAATPAQNNPASESRISRRIVLCARRAAAAAVRTHSNQSIEPSFAKTSAQSIKKGAARIRTGDGGFADLCLTTWLRRRDTIRLARPFERSLPPAVATRGTIESNDTLAREQVCLHAKPRTQAFLKLITASPIAHISVSSPPV